MQDGFSFPTDSQREEIIQARYFWENHFNIISPPLVGTPLLEPRLWSGAASGTTTPVFGLVQRVFRLARPEEAGVYEQISFGFSVNQLQPAAPCACLSVQVMNGPVRERSL